MIKENKKWINRIEKIIYGKVLNCQCIDCAYKHKQLEKLLNKVSKSGQDFKSWKREK
jgi:hypothetical protein